MAARSPGEFRLAASVPAIRVRGARVHNLRDVDVDLPHNQLVVLTGVSGSGKSSLAFDTLYAEGQRRYIESLSSYARQFLDQLERPDLDLMEGLPPTVAIDQRAGMTNPRSTVATITEIHDYLRVMYARVGEAHCPECGTPFRRQTPEQIVNGVLALTEGRKVLILSPLVRARKGAHLDVFEAIRRAGLLRVRVDGEISELGDPPPKLAKTKVHDIEAVVDRLVVREGIRPRLAESIDLALKLSQGTVIISAQSDSGWTDQTLSIHYACPACGASYHELEPRTFSFNSPQGACPTCDGLGTVSSFDRDLVIPDRTKSIAQGAIAPWSVLSPRVRQADDLGAALGPFLKRHRSTRESPLSAWPAKTLKLLLEGEPTHQFPGILADLESVWGALKTDAQRALLHPFRDETPCPDCQGARLNQQARSVTVGGMTIHDLSSLPITDSLRFLETLRFTPPTDQIGGPLAVEIRQRLEFLDRVGLGYLTLARGSDTLSGGELQRVRLASQIGSGLVGVCYILDEPTAGLHPRDTERLLDSLRALRDQGNSVVVVEHDEATIRAADWVVDLGPGAGPDGGRITALGPPNALEDAGESLTARYLQQSSTNSPTKSGRLQKTLGWVSIHGASDRNLKGIDVKFPLGCLTAVSGVSGSGKSTLVLDILARAARRKLYDAGPRPGAHDRIEGLEAFDQLVEIDQTPIGRGPRSTPATYTGVFDEIRKVFARTREAKLRGYSARRFSFNAKEGRCEQCEGQGMLKIAMNFLPDLFIPCDSCGGLRYNRPTLDVRFKGKSIGEVLALRVDEAMGFFDAQMKVFRGLKALHEAGLGYLTLGQSSTTLSGGEAQRIKLAGQLARITTGKTLYILDEPTTGLHFADVDRLLGVLNRLAEMGNTLVIIEHNLEVIRTADWMIDLGPDGGNAGGQVVAMGTPEEVADISASATGQFLRQSRSA